MDQTALITQMTDQLKGFPALLTKWRHFLTLSHSAGIPKVAQQLILQKIIVKQETEWSYTFKLGINDLTHNSEANENELYYLIKFCLTGKNNFSSQLKDVINKLYLEFKLEELTYTTCITLAKKVRGAIYQLSIDEINHSHKVDSAIVAKGGNLKELQESFKAFFSKKLNLPFLINASFHHHQLISHPITFASYYSFLFLEEKRPYKIFSEEQSTFWRKRAFQVLLGLKGIPYISFFQTLMAESQFEKYQAEGIKQCLEEKSCSIVVNQLDNNEKRYLQLLKRKEELGQLKLSFTESYKEQFHLNLELKIDKNIHDLEYSLHALQSKETKILKEIRLAGGNFQPKKSYQKHLDNTDNQISLFIAQSTNSVNNKEKIETLVGDYYLNLSQIEVIGNDLEELRKQKEEELKKIEYIKKEESLKLDKDIALIDQQLFHLLNKQKNWFGETIKTSIFSRNIAEEITAITNCIQLIKELFQEIHQTRLIQFLQQLKENLDIFNFPNLRSVTFNKNYIPKIIYNTNEVLLFTYLPDVQKELFIVCFYLALFQSGFKETDSVPIILLLNYPHKQNIDNHWQQKITAILQKLNYPYQIIMTSY